MTSERFKGYLTAEPRDATYRALLQNIARYSTSASLVARPEFGLSSEGEKIVRELTPWRRSVRTVSSWPGTRLLEGGTAELQTYEVHRESLELLQRAVPGLFGWIEGYPEDLAFYRADGSVILWSVAHEAEGELEVDSEEKDCLMQASGFDVCIVWRATGDQAR